MEQLDLRSLENALGIYHPWAIKTASADADEKCFDVHLELRDKKRLLGLFGSHRKSNDEALSTGCWEYISVGNFRCKIHAQIPASIESAAPISLALINQAAFLGNPSRKYSNHLRQQIALAQIKGLDISMIAELLNIDTATIQTIEEDLKAAPTQVKALAYLPSETDPSWTKVLLDQQLLRTNVLPLKLLLSKLKLSAAKSESADEIQSYVIELRKFFVANANSMDSEIDQLCGLSSEKMQHRVRAVKNKQKLVLPSIKNPLWLDLLSGKLRLNSHSIPLNLLISRQRVAFVQGPNTQAKIQAIEIIRTYFRKNYRTLKPELVLLNRAMRIKEKTQVRLPNPDDNIWQKILVDDNFVPSDHVAYKLLLAKLRTQITTEQDPVIKLEAARRIRDFIKQNQKSMRKELSLLLKQSKAG